jgi:hypothetical protein
VVTRRDADPSWDFAKQKNSLLWWIAFEAEADIRNSGQILVSRLRGLHQDEMYLVEVLRPDNRIELFDWLNTKFA